MYILYTHTHTHTHIYRPLDACPGYLAFDIDFCVAACAIGPKLEKPFKSHVRHTSLNECGAFGPFLGEGKPLN